MFENKEIITKIINNLTKQNQLVEGKEKLDGIEISIIRKGHKIR